MTRLNVLNVMQNMEWETKWKDNDQLMGNYAYHVFFSKRGAARQNAIVVSQRSLKAMLKLMSRLNDAKVVFAYVWWISQFFGRKDVGVDQLCIACRDAWKEQEDNMDKLLYFGNKENRYELNCVKILYTIANLPIFFPQF